MHASGKEFQSGIVLTKKEFKHWLQVAGKCLYLCLCLCLVRLSAGNRVPSACTATLPVTILNRNVSLMSRGRSFRGAHLRSFKYDCTAIRGQLSISRSDGSYSLCK